MNYIPLEPTFKPIMDVSPFGFETDFLLSLSSNVFIILIFLASACLLAGYQELALKYYFLVTGNYYNNQTITTHEERNKAKQEIFTELIRLAMCFLMTLFLTCLLSIINRDLLSLSIF